MRRGTCLLPLNPYRMVYRRLNGGMPEKKQARGVDPPDLFRLLKLLLDDIQQFHFEDEGGAGLDDRR